MPFEPTTSPDTSCPRCQTTMVAQTVKTTIWQGERVAIVEDIPALVCSSCMEQFYDPDVGDALRRLVEEGLPVTAAKKEILVPVFSLEGRILTRKAFPEDADVE